MATAPGSMLKLTPATRHPASLPAVELHQVFDPNRDAHRRPPGSSAPAPRPLHQPARPFLGRGRRGHDHSPPQPSLTMIFFPSVAPV